HPHGYWLEAEVRRGGPRGVALRRRIATFMRQRRCERQQPARLLASAFSAPSSRHLRLHPPVSPPGGARNSGSGHSYSLNEHPRSLNEHPRSLAEHPCSVAEHPCSLNEHPCSLNEHPC